MSRVGPVRAALREALAAFAQLRDGTAERLPGSNPRLPGRNPLRDYVVSKFDRIKRHFDQVIDVNVVLDVEKQTQHAEATVAASGTVPPVRPLASVM